MILYSVSRVQQGSHARNVLNDSNKIGSSQLCFMLLHSNVNILFLRVMMLWLKGFYEDKIKINH